MDRRQVLEKVANAWVLGWHANEMGIFGDGNVIEKIMDQLSDAMLWIVGEENKNYVDTKTYDVLHSSLTAKEMACQLEDVAKENETRNGPVFFSQEQIEAMQRVFGGYVYGKE